MPDAEGHDMRVDVGEPEHERRNSDEQRDLPQTVRERLGSGDDHRENDNRAVDEAGKLLAEFLPVRELHALPLGVADRSRALSAFMAPVLVGESAKIWLRDGDTMDPSSNGGGSEQTLYNRGVSTPRAELIDQRLLEAHKSAMSRRWRVQRRHYERDTRRDIDAAGAKIERHHLTEPV